MEQALINISKFEVCLTYHGQPPTELNKIFNKAKNVYSGCSYGT